MIQNEVVYICDCCGKRKSEIQAFHVTDQFPEGWSQMIDPFGLCCDKCMAEFMGVYERIHAPEKARKMYEEEGYGR